MVNTSFFNRRRRRGLGRNNNNAKGNNKSQPLASGDRLTLAVEEDPEFSIDYHRVLGCSKSSLKENELKQQYWKMATKVSKNRSDLTGCCVLLLLCVCQSRVRQEQN